MEQNSATRPERTTLIPVSIRTPHTDLLYQLLNAHIAITKCVLDPPVPIQVEPALEEPNLWYVPKSPHVVDDLAKWRLQKLELLFADSFGKRPPATLAEIYQMLAAMSDRGSLGSS